MCVVLTVCYVLLLRLTSAVVSPNDGEAALVELDGKVVGAANVGQAFTDSVYFWGRPSAVEYNGGGSIRPATSERYSGLFVPLLLPPEPPPLYSTAEGRPQK